MTNKRKIINDPVYGFLTIDDDLLYDLISHPYLLRESQIKQLGFTYMVYPGAMHSRFSHMLGALNLMNRAIDVLRSKGVTISDEESLGVKVAILLHDIGHGPFSHTSEHMLADIDHETFTLLFMQRLNEQFNGRLSTAISIFDDTYPRHFLHQLVSSQLDMDRLDYLARDSFFTGVSEGIVGTERIINMLNVTDDMLVVDEKGVYSIEKFIISRRLMYWQVYMHKTVIVADNIFYNIMRRARELYKPTDETSLLHFLTHRHSEADFRTDPSLLDLFATIDDNDVITTVKKWIHHDDKILRNLSSMLINRHLSAIKVGNQPVTSDLVDSLRERLCQLFDIDRTETEYYIGTGILRNNAYNFNDQEIRVRLKDGSILDISEASDQLDHRFLEKQVTKYYVYYPKELRQS
ncbi:MAG: HD domain-containing protein [Bacteroidales bacterium]|nr:HD domain-containing protein [Bacteroidales bacterium]